MYVSVLKIQTARVQLADKQKLLYCSGSRSAFS